MLFCLHQEILIVLKIIIVMKIVVVLMIIVPVTGSFFNSGGVLTVVACRLVNLLLNAECNKAFGVLYNDSI